MLIAWYRFYSRVFVSYHERASLGASEWYTKIGSHGLHVTTAIK